MTDFVHLHCHTEYSLLDGAIKVRDVCSRAVAYGQSAAAITDHGNLFGALDFYLTAKDYGIKPIIGCEVYVAPERHDKKDAGSAAEAGYHLVLLAQNRQGYHNLIKLVSKANLDGFYYKPRVDKELLARWNHGLIAMSACLKGEIPSVLLSRGMEAAKSTAREYSELFPGRFYLELMDNDLPQQEELNPRLAELGEETGLPLVATNDCHYLDREDARAHDTLLCIQTNSCVHDQKRMRVNTDKLFYRSPEDMQQAFSHLPQALENTRAIAEACNLELDLGKPRFPVYHAPDERSLDQVFRDMARDGLRDRLAKTTHQIEESVYWERLEQELEVICTKGFSSYFLIVQDFINWAKERGIPVGPGRGSAAGSLAAYALKITNIDPIRYGLLFERFLNVERESLPDIDVDFCYNRREEVIRYVTEKYGKDNVAQITTFGTMKARAVVRDVGRALGMSFAETDKIAKLIPEDPGISIDKALEGEPDLRKKRDEDERVAKCLDISRKLEGLARHASTHAAGIVISDQPMEEYLPLYRGKKGEVVTQYDMKKVEKVGLIKFDFLGLKTLTVLQDTLELARDSGKEVPDLETMTMDDPQTFELLCKGQTNGVFQLESSGMRGVMMDLKPERFEELIALLALYRPGPLESGMVTDFVERKHGRREVQYPHPWLEPVLKETYGVILYQEQVMRIASELAGYSLGDGDLLRRAMGKKNAKAMAQQRDKFMQGALERGLDRQTAEHLFDLIEKFAGYGFNKSHSSAYAMISYQTAYMKTHYPQEFMAALITSEVANTDKVISHLGACREMGIEVLPPDINQSEHSFTVRGENILFGLSGIKNVGDGAIRQILKERRDNGPFHSLMDLCQRVLSKRVSKRVLESLIKSGALDCLGATRAALMASLDRVVAKAQKRSKARAGGKLSLLSMVRSGEQEQQTQSGIGLNIPEAETEEWQEEYRLQQEKEALGLFLSGHPLLKHQHDLQRLRVQTVQECREMPPGNEVNLAVLITGCKEIQTRKGDKMAFCQVEDLSGTAELTLFPDAYAKIRDHDFDQPFFCRARIDSDQNESGGEEEAPRSLKLLARDVEPLAEAQPATDEPCTLDVEAARVDEAKWRQLKQILTKYPGPNPVNLQLWLDEAVCRMTLGPDYRIQPASALYQELDQWKRSLQTDTNASPGAYADARSGE
jgi:DNA polymerase-3 subunit alpha